MKKIASVLFLSFAIAVVSLPAEARKGRHGKGMHAKMMKELGLNDEQKAKVKEIRKEYKPKMKEIRAEKKEARKKFHEVFASEADSDDVRDAHEKITDLKEKLHELKLKKMLAIRDVLNVDQRKKFMEMKKKRWKKHHKMAN